MAKTINAVFTSGVFTRTAKVFQWDSGDKLAFVNVDLPNSYQVHFANSLTGASKTVLGDSSGVAIPPEYFVPGSEIYAWVWLSTENGGYTKYQVTIPIYRRAQPQNVTPTPAQIDALDEAINTINAAIESGIITPEEKQKLAGIEAGAEVNKLESIGYTTPDGGEETQPGPLSGTFASLPDYFTPLVYEFAWDGTDVTTSVIWNDVFGSSDATQKYAYVTDPDGHVLKLRLIVDASGTAAVDAMIVFYGIGEDGTNYILHMGEELNSWVLDDFNPEMDIGNLSNLTTTAKSSLVSAMNEVNEKATDASAPAKTWIVEWTQDGPITPSASSFDASVDVTSVTDASSSNLPKTGDFLLGPEPGHSPAQDVTYLYTVYGLNSAKTKVRLNVITELASGGGTSDYTDLTNKPQINGHTLSGNQSASDLGLGTYSKPSGGIPATDLASGVIPSAYTSNPAALGTASAGSSSNYAKGDHVHPKPTAADIGAIAAPSSPSVGDFLVYTSNGWAAQSLSTWSGGNY